MNNTIVLGNRFNRGIL